MRPTPQQSRNHPIGAHELHVRNLEATYNRGHVRALHGINFSIRCGHSLAVMGANGAGKSTLLRALAGLMRINCGEILWNGTPLRTARHEIAWVPQRSTVDRNYPMTVRALAEQGRLPAVGLLRPFSPQDRACVEHALVAMQLTSLQDRPLCELSGGQQQRAFLARALAQQAHILLLDEPFTGLDMPGTQDLGCLFRTLAREEGRLVIAACHNIDAVPRYFDCVLLLRTGEMIDYGESNRVLTAENIARAFGRTSPEPGRTNAAMS